MAGSLHVEHWYLDANAGAELAGIQALEFLGLSWSRRFFRTDTNLLVFVIRGCFRGPQKPPYLIIDLASCTDGVRFPSRGIGDD